MTGWQGWIPTRVYIDVMAASAPVKATLRDAIANLIGLDAIEAGTRFWPARDISITDLSEQTDTQFIHRDQIDAIIPRSEEHTSELQSLMRISYAVFCLKKKQKTTTQTTKNN